MIKSILKGMVIGIANIVPGVSGGTLMVSMGVYDKLIHCITHLFREFRKSVLFLLPIAIGMGVAIVGSSLGLEYLFTHFPVPTNFLFVGLILGGLPAIWKNVKGSSMHLGHAAIGLFFFALVVGFAAVGETEGNAVELSRNAGQAVLLFGVGVIASATMVIPGVSGSMVLLLIGYYHPILSTITEVIRALLAWNWAGIWNGMGILLPFGLGVVAGIFGIAKLVELVFLKFPLYAYWAIIGLLVSSPVAIFLIGTFPEYTIPTIVTGFAAAFVGFVAAMKLGV
ncbi:MAG: DUF368 domain-containing protein [Clostridium sp.]|jgi:putative membrane protein|nr:DUF368 domain-containing protein [Clostridium sp.]